MSCAVKWGGKRSYSFSYLLCLSAIRAWNLPTFVCSLRLIAAAVEQPLLCSRFHIVPTQHGFSHQICGDEPTA
eukprot:2394011-Amphidinium_carterae.1